MIRVYESLCAPHETTEGRIYIRTNDVSCLRDDGKDAQVSEIEFLLNRRFKSADLSNKRMGTLKDDDAIVVKIMQVLLFSEFHLIYGCLKVQMSQRQLITKFA
ncbi:MAG: hypothetical protein K2Z81_00055 [Cyanobacteria bacterium]|nr:hypothetical protein [Cyanobacteriota bacterium]